MSRLSPNMHQILTENVIKSLNNLHIYTVLDFVTFDSGLIEKNTNLALREILEVRKELVKKFSAQPKNAFDYYQFMVNNSAIISTGIKNVDKLLDGGIFTGNIYEFSGLPATGKTLLCLNITKETITKLKEKVYYIDTKQDFSGKKLKEMLILDQKELIDALNNVLVKQINSTYDLINTLFEIERQINDGFQLRVIIIDSLAALCLPSSDRTENNVLLNHVANILRFLANERNVAILVTNLITLWNEGDFTNHSVWKEKIACGSYWSTVPNVKLKLEKKEQNEIKITLSKPLIVLPADCECKVIISDKGLE